MNQTMVVLGEDKKGLNEDINIRYNYYFITNYYIELSVKCNYA